MQGRQRLTAYTDERCGAVRALELPAASRKWELAYRRTHKASRDFQQVQSGIAGCKQSSSWAPEGEESPVSVIGHNMAMQVEQSHSSSAGSTSVEHSLANFSSALVTAPLRGPSHLRNESSCLESVDASASDYAGLLSQHVQQAFRQSHELQPQVKRWPSSTSSRRMESRHLQEDAPLLICNLSSTQNQQSRTTATGGRCTSAMDVRPATSSEEEKLSICSSSITDGQDDEDSVIDFFPASKNKPTIEIVNKHEYVTRRLGSSCSDINIKVHTGRRALSKSSGSWVTGGNELGALVYGSADDHPKAELGRPSASYKWDDADRWISAAGPAPPPETLYRATSADVNTHGRLPKFALPLGTRSMQVQSYQPSTETTIFTQDKHIPSSVGRAIARSHQWKRDVGTQSTPAGLSQSDSPEVCTVTSTADEKSNSKDAGTTATATAHTVSPRRHNTPERPPASYTKERENANACDDVGGTGKLDMAELQSCHLEKMNLAQDLPLGTSSTWQLVADDENEQAVDLIGRGCSPHHHYKSHAIKVNMLEARVAAWEEVERAKYIAKFKKEEAKIEAWEGLRRAEANAELQKLEVKLEKMRFESRDKIMGRLEAAQRRAQEMKGIAEAQKKEQLTRLATRANQLRKSGNLPSAAFNVMCSLSAKIKPT